MAWENAVLSEDQNDVEVDHTEREYHADMLTRATVDSTSLALLTIVSSRRRQETSNKGVNDEFEQIIGASGALRKVLDLVRTVAPTNSTALIEGETGTGKELIARAIHKRSNRASRAFIRVNCASIPDSLIASELFGHEKGAFTGALQRRIGRFESANGGTIFLDEIGDISMETQLLF
jgi:transcriptional regulator with GAF, ATPase, and Fis domain